MERAAEPLGVGVVAAKTDAFSSRSGTTYQDNLGTRGHPTVVVCKMAPGNSRFIIISQSERLRRLKSLGKYLLRMWKHFVNGIKSYK